MTKEEAEDRLDLAELCLRYQMEMTVRARELWYRNLQEVSRMQENVLKAKLALKQFDP